MHMISAKELLRRQRVVKGWAFLNLSKDEVASIREYLSGGAGPKGYEEADKNEPMPKR